MKAWFLLAALLAYMAELIDVFYLLHVSLHNEALWPQFGVGYLLYFTTSLMSARFLLPVFQDTRFWMLTSCYMHVLIGPIFFLKLDYLFVLVLALMGFFRMDSISTLALFSVTDPQELSRRSFQLKIVYYIALVGASLAIFLIWVYPITAPIFTSFLHFVFPLVGLLIRQCTKSSVVPPILSQAEETPMAKRVYHLEMQLTCDFVALSTYMMVYFVHQDVIFLPVTNIIFAIVCIGLVFVGYHFIRKHNINGWYILYLYGLGLAWVGSAFAFVFEANTFVHPIVHLVAMLLFAMVHISPWNVLFQLEAGSHILAMIEHRIIGQGLGFLVGLAVYQGWRAAPYLPLCAMGIYAVIAYEKEYLKPE